MTDQFDVIVIGGGSAGSAVAARLSEDPKMRVCLLEAGGDNDDWRIKTPGMMPFIPAASNYRYETVPQPGLGGRTGYQPRGRGLGGSSAINAMVYIRGNAWDYDNWAAMGCTGWAYDDVLPWFKRSEGNERGGDAYHGGDGPLTVGDQHWTNPGSRAFVASAGALQMKTTDDFNGADQRGFGLYQVTQKGGERWSAARAYLGPARGRANLDIRTDVLVEKILVEDGRAVGVAIRRGKTRETIRASGAVVLSAGAFNSPQILMCSGIGPGAQLTDHNIAVAADRAGVGANLHDHIDYVAGFATQSRDFMGQTLAGTIKVVKAIWEHRRHRTGTMTTPYAEAGGFWSVMPDAPVPDVQFHFVPALLEDHGREKVRGHGFSCHACVLRPESRGSVSLASSDTADAPVIDPGFLTDDKDIAVLREGVRLMYRIFAAPPLAGYAGIARHPVNIADDAALDAMIRSRADTVYHPVGTCRMGSDADSVVDPRLRVRGVEGLYVADASIMPQIVSGNTNAPSIMIGERCSAFVRDELRT
jgi:choline dehydrogenase-like flavoprotein